MVPHSPQQFHQLAQCQVQLIRKYSVFRKKENVCITWQEVRVGGEVQGRCRVEKYLRIKMRFTNLMGN